MARYSDTVRDQNGVPVIGALVAVTLQDGSLPAMTDDEGTALANPLTTDGYGNFYFNLVGSAFVNLKIYYGGVLRTEEFGVLVGQQSAIPVGVVTWPELEVIEGNSPGELALVANDDGTHIDPVSGDEVPNEGVYSWTSTDWTWLTSVGGAQIPIVFDLGSVALSTPMIDVSETWNGTTDDIFDGVKVTVTDTVSNPSSRLMSLSLGSRRVHEFRKDAQYILRKSNISIGGIVCVGTVGEMALTSGISNATGNPANVFRWYWEGGVNGSGIADETVSVLRGTGTNRTSIESGSAMTHIADASRFEWEGSGSSPPRLLFLGYDKGTANGRTIDFTNYGQTPARASPIVSFSGQSNADKVVSFGTNSGSSWVERGSVTANGNASFDNRVMGGRLATATYTVAALPASPVAGDLAFVTDATAPTWGATIVGGGAVKCPVFYDGANWKAG